MAWRWCIRAIIATAATPNAGLVGRIRLLRKALRSSRSFKRVGEGAAAMAHEATLDRLSAVEREVRFVLPFFARVAVLVNEARDMPSLEGRSTGMVELSQPSGGEIGSAIAGARIEQFRAGGFGYLLVPADVYPWLREHRDVLRYLRSHFRRVPADESVCNIYALQPIAPGTPRVAEDDLPIPPPEMIGLVAGGLPPSGWFEKGRYGVTWIREMLARNGIELGRIGSLLDFGCGCGRVIRHWPGLTDARLHGSDYNPYLVDWCSNNLPVGEFSVNGLEPPLPFDDDSFDLVYSLSIFTHLDESLQVPWMEEMIRVTKPGGVFVLTFHGRSRLEHVDKFENSEEIVRAFEAGELVVWRGEQAGGSGCAAWHPQAYVYEVLARDVEVIDYSPSGALDIRQDAVLFRKPAE